MKYILEREILFLVRWISVNVELEAARIIDFIKKIIHDSRTQGIMVGLSGGIDSALTAALCVQAVNKENVLALILPCHSIEADLNDAKLVTEHLGINYYVIDLTKSFDVFLKALLRDQKANKLAEANLKPRMRMCSLYFYANQLNYLVAGTGNKSEDEIGYFTKYGDGGADFLPIQHLYKHEVRELAKFLKLPQKIIDRKPSAGLWEGQTDEDEISQQLGFSVSYNELSEMIENIINSDYNTEDPKYQKVVELRQKNRHKLVPPPALKRRRSVEK